jgi:hypothetical protein
MKPMNDRPQLERPVMAGQPAPKKRFRIEKLEERIAPSKGGNTTKFTTTHCGSRSAD